MKTRLASVVAAFALLFGALLMTAGTASATGETDPSFECNNVLGIGQLCENLDNVVVTVTHIGVLNPSDLVDVKNVLNNWAITGIGGDVTVVKGDVVNLYKNVFNIPILSNNVIIIGWPTCGC
jgi:hypothetical protein